MKHILTAAIPFAVFRIAFALGVSDGEADAMARSLVAGMTLDEKVSMLSGSGTMTIKVPGVSREWQMSDNSHTVRPDMDRWTWAYCGDDDEGTVMPALSALAATWSRRLAQEYGDVLGEEARARGKNQILGPGVNMMRLARCGRNWEYLGEDPYLASQLVVPYIKGLQAHGVAATVKHFALNNQELARHEVDSICGERAMHEIYFPAFKAAVTEAGVWAVMTSYNKVNGEWASENAHLQRDVLREGWGFKGMIVSDWGGTCSTVKSALSGGGVEMNRGDRIKFFSNPKTGEKPLAEAVRRGEVPEAAVDGMACHALWTMAKTGFFSEAAFDASRCGRNTPAHRRAARAIAEEAIVLLKNDARVLPFAPEKIKSIVVLGELAAMEFCRKGYSAEGKPPYEVTALEGLREYFAKRRESPMPSILFAGFDAMPPDDVLTAADAVVAFTGTDLGTGDFKEGESADRKDLSLSAVDNEAIGKLLSLGLENLAIAVHSGSPVELPWADKAATILHQPYLGQESGRALARVLFGDVNPSGRLPCTWPKSMVDTPCAQYGAYSATNSVYSEGVFIGYRWYDAKDIAPLFPFGHGLSYTEFEYSGMSAVKKGDGAFEVSLQVANTGEREGKEVVQLYVASVDPVIERPPKELKGFEKISLAPGEKKTVSFTLCAQDFAYWDEATGGWRVDPGEYRLIAGSSSRDGRLEMAVTVDAWKGSIE